MSSVPIHEEMRVFVGHITDLIALLDWVFPAAIFTLVEVITFIPALTVVTRIGIVQGLPPLPWWQCPHPAATGVTKTCLLSWLQIFCLTCWNREGMKK